MQTVLTVNKIKILKKGRIVQSLLSSNFLAGYRSVEPVSIRSGERTE